MSEELHPGFGTRNSDNAPTSSLPFGNSLRKRSLPNSNHGLRGQSAGAVDAMDSSPASVPRRGGDGGGVVDGEYYAAHSSPQSNTGDFASSSPSRESPEATPQKETPSRALLTPVKSRSPRQHVRTMDPHHNPDDHLTFFQTHFTKPIDRDPEKYYKANNRRFSLFSAGFIITAVIMLFLLLGSIAAAVAVSLDHGHYKQRSGYPSIPQGPTIPPPNTNESSPIRVAIEDNFPDPSILSHNGIWYAFATNDAAGILAQPSNSTNYEYGASNVQIATSLDFVTWDLLNSSHDPLPVAGAWAPQGLTKVAPKLPRANVWAPGHFQRKTDNKFVLFYSADAANATNPSPHHPPPHCVGVAVSRTDSPAGPYDAVNTTLACPVDQGGAIDPAGFVDTDGSMYVLYKIDGNNIGNGGLCGNTKKPIVPTPIMLQKMYPNGTTGNGHPVKIMDRIAADGPLVEAPALMRGKDGTYFLFFSSGCTRSPTYDVKYATSKKIAGPYVRAAQPLLQTGDWGLLAPGSVGIHEDGNGGWNMAFHARVSMPQGRVRAMFTTKLELNGKVATIVRNNATAS